MLQPLQLKDVSVRYTKEITELQDFLLKADCVVGTVESLGRIAARLPRDRAFHRDLTSHVWVVIHGCDRQISYSDLLGVLAIAAAGTSFAAMAEEDDAHDLLRFLMEARHSLDTVRDDRGGVPVRWAAESAANLSAQPFQSTGGDEQEIVGRPVELLQRDLNTQKVPQDIGSGLRRALWMAAAACVMVALLSIGLWLKPWSAAGVGNTPATVTPAAAGSVSSPSVTDRQVSPSTVRPNETVATAVVDSPSARKNSRQMPASAFSAPLHAADIPPHATAGAPQGPASATAMEAAPTISARTVHPSTSPAAPPALRAGGIASPPPVSPPAATFTGRLGAPSNLLDPSELGRDTPASRTSKAPILLRRRLPVSAADSEDGTNLASEVRSTDIPTILGTSRAGSADAKREGIVRLTSLGTMAANIMYSPMPTYPTAASASHVQGQVKVSAEVDREGNVASVRIISGPPLLRDAALDAVQRWRYRPYMASGEPTPMTAIAIMDFQLP